MQLSIYPSSNEQQQNEIVSIVSCLKKLFEVWGHSGTRMALALVGNPAVAAQLGSAELLPPESCAEVAAPMTSQEICAALDDINVELRSYWPELHIEFKDRGEDSGIVDFWIVDDHERKQERVLFFPVRAMGDTDPRTLDVMAYNTRERSIVQIRDVHGKVIDKVEMDVMGPLLLLLTELAYAQGIYQTVGAQSITVKDDEGKDWIVDKGALEGYALFVRGCLALASRLNEDAVSQVRNALSPLERQLAARALQVFPFMLSHIPAETLEERGKAALLGITTAQRMLLALEPEITANARHDASYPQVGNSARQLG